MELLLKQESGDEDILIPAAMLHDTGWSKIPVNLQKTNDKTKVNKAMELHLKFSAPIVVEVLTKLGYTKNPRSLGKRLLIDADTLVDVFRE